MSRLSKLLTSNFKFSTNKDPKVTTKVTTAVLPKGTTKVTTSLVPPKVTTTVVPKVDGGLSRYGMNAIYIVFTIICFHI